MASVESFIPAVLGVADVAARGARQQKAAEAQAEQVAAQNRILAQQQAQREKQQRDLLARQVATARARLSAGGGGLDGGSGLALLGGLVRQSEEDIANSAVLSGMRQAGASDRLSSASGLEKALQLYDGVAGGIGRL